MRKSRYLIICLFILVIVIGVVFSKKIIIKEKVDNQISVQNEYLAENSECCIEQNENNLDENQIKEMFEKYYDDANNLLNKMTLEEKVGQMFYARYPSGNANSEIKINNPGGYILFAKDFKDENKISMLNKINENQSNSKIKMFMGVDEEGGSVVRVSKYKAFRNTKFESPQTLWNQGRTFSNFRGLGSKI